jgi:hypothetical protein
MLRLIASLLIVGVVSLEAQTPPAPQGSSGLSGVVTRLDNDKPIAGAQIQLQRVSATGAVVPRTATPTTRTDETGSYKFEKLPAGAYVVTATADKFFPLDATFNRQQGSGKRVDLVDGQQLERFDMVLSPASAIEGRALDEFGDPAPGVTMAVTQLVQAAGRSRLMPLPRGTATTDDRGVFRVSGLPSGDYYLLSLSGPFGTQGNAAYSSAADQRAGFAPTYFPGTASAVDAKPVHVEVGRDTTGLSVGLVPSRLFTVSGRVTDASGGTPAGPLMMLQTQGGDVRAIIPANVPVGADGKFSIRNVPQGSYVLQARSQRGFGTALIVVSDRDVTDVAIAALPPRTARGRVVFEGGNPPAKEQVQILVGPTDFVSGPIGGQRLPPARISDDGTFELSGLQHVGVLMGTATPNWRLRRVLLAGEDITDKPYDFRARDVTDLEVVLSDRWASMEATVVTVAGQPAVDYTVLVFSQDPTKWTFPTRHIVTGRTTQMGVFRAGGLPGGEYLVAAMPSTAAIGQEVDAALLESLRASATKATLSEGQDVTVSVRLVR